MLTELCLITVGKEEEAGWITVWAEQCGGSVEVSENTRDPIYDRWVCRITRENP